MDSSYQLEVLSTDPAPISVTGASDTLYLSDQHGFISKYDPITKTESLFIDIRPNMPTLNRMDTRGLFDVVMTPDRTRLITYYTSKSPSGFEERYPDGQNVLVEYNIATRQPTILLRMFNNAGVNNGGRMAFGIDGYLYLGIGDGGPEGDPQQKAQNLSSLQGKILRLDVDRPSGYRVPSDNPFVNYPGLRPEIYAYGFRNPWGVSFSESGVGYIADRGESWETISILKRGGNYGWNLKDGSHPTNFNQGTTGGTHLESSLPLDRVLIDPIYEYPKRGSDEIVGGGLLSNGEYIFGDSSGLIMILKRDGSVEKSSPLKGYIRSFSTDLNSNMYMMTSSKIELDGEGKYSALL